MGAEREPRRILVVKLADYGDVLLCEPALRSLRWAFPAAAIDVLTSPGPSALVPLMQLRLRVIEFPKHAFDQLCSLARPSNALLAGRHAVGLRRGRYDMVVLLHHLTTPFGTRKFRALVAATGAPTVAGLDNGRGTFLTHRVADLGFGARHEAEYMLAVAGAAGGHAVDPAPALPHIPAPMEFGLPADYAVVFPATGAYSDARAWPVEKFAELASRLDAAGLPIVVVGAADASPAAALIRTRLPSALDLTGRTTVPELVGVVGAARVVCGGDSFVGHLAAALRRPIVSIFGPSNANAWRPFARTSKRHVGLMPLSTVVSAGLPCQPCFYTGYRLGRRDGCPDRTCLRHVSVDQVTTAVLAAAGMA